MNLIIQYIANNYIWILIVIVVILLAIVGYFADKNNFGQPRTKEKNIKKEKKIDLDKVTLGDLASGRIKETPILSEKENLKSKETNDVKADKKEDDNQKTEILDATEGINGEFNKEFEALIPKKEIMPIDLINDIDNLSLDKTQKLELSDIPDLDDINLPSIKKFDKNEDIWKK